MNFIKQIERIEKLNKLIEQEKTGTPEQLAARLTVSRSKLYEMIDYLKCLGLEIHFDRSRETFIYSKEKHLDIKFSLKLINQGEVKNIYGGQCSVASVLFSGRSRHILGMERTFPR